MNSNQGEDHPQAKLTEIDVALARLLARDRTMYRGWMLDMATALGVADATISFAVGGHTWKCIADPRPVPARRRHHPLGRSGGTRPKCPACGHAKCYPVRDGRPCRDRFHSIDHRSITSPINARKANAANRTRTRGLVS